MAGENAFDQQPQSQEELIQQLIDGAQQAYGQTVMGPSPAQGRGLPPRPVWPQQHDHSRGIQNCPVCNPASRR